MLTKQISTTQLAEAPSLDSLFNAVITKIILIQRWEGQRWVVHHVYPGGSSFDESDALNAVAYLSRHNPRIKFRALKVESEEVRP